MKIGLLLRKLRTKRCLSQQYVADILEISRNAYIAIENDTTNITLSRVEQICELYDISITDFFAEANRDIAIGVRPRP